MASGDASALVLAHFCELRRDGPPAAVQRSPDHCVAGQGKRPVVQVVDDPEDEGDLATSTFTVARQRDGRLDIADEPVEFTLVRPGESLLKDRKAAE